MKSPRLPGTGIRKMHAAPEPTRTAPETTGCQSSSLGVGTGAQQTFSVAHSGSGAPLYTSDLKGGDIPTIAQIRL